MKHNLLLTALFVIMLLTSFTLTAEEKTTEPAMLVGDAAVAVLTVVAINQESREFTLKDDEGNEANFTAGPEVRNFDQIKRGDQVLVSFYESFELDFGSKGSGVRKRIDSVDVQRAELGEKPAIQITDKIDITGLVETVDIASRKITVKGAQRTVVLTASESFDLSQVNVGDEVEGHYIGSSAIEVIPAPEVSGTVQIESTSVAIGIGVEWGHGTLTMYDGTTHKFDISGLSVLDFGISEISATGEVFNLVEAKDLNGIFVAGKAGAALGGGGSAMVMKNENGVVIQLKSTQVGLKLTLAPEGLQIDLVE